MCFAPQRRAIFHLSHLARKVAQTPVFFQWFVAPESRKVGLAKAAGAEPAGKMKKLHAVVARSTFPSQNVTKHTILGSLLEVEMSKKCTPLLAGSTFRSQNVQSTPCTDPLLDRFARAGRKGLCTLSKVSKNFCSISKNDGQAWDIWRGSAKMHFPWQAQYIETLELVRRWGRWFPERGCILEHQICRFAKMIICDRCSTSYDPGINFSWQAQYFRL